jgi:xanthine/CO dehydrogenase XdhC/CoxF family maturation factor
MLVIETLYKCEIHWDSPVVTDWSKKTPDERITDYAFYVTYDTDVICSTTAAGHAWNAYVVLTGHNKTDVTRCAKAIARYIKRFKGIKFL